MKGDRPKVGMCGDGANDLLALREADLSLGMSHCDASYASSFTINNLLDVDEVIRESKNNVSNILQLFMYLMVCFIPSKLASIVMITNGVDNSEDGTFYYNFTSLLIFPLLIPLSKPTNKPNPYTPVSSFITLYSHLVIWGQIIILTLVTVLTYVYFK